MPLCEAYSLAVTTNRISHRLTYVCSGIDPHGLFYVVIDAASYNKQHDGRIITCVG